MKSPFTPKETLPKDWENLSAYLDEQLSSRQHARLAARLQREPKLQAALDELRQTRAILRSAPKFRAPRNFMVTPEMAGQHPGSRIRWYPAFQFASALASLLFILVVAGDLFSFGRLASAPAGEMAVPQMVTVQEDNAAPRKETAVEIAKEFAAPEEELAASEALADEPAAPQALAVEAEVMAGEEPQPQVETSVDDVMLAEAPVAPKEVVEVEAVPIEGAAEKIGASDESSSGLAQPAADEKAERDSEPPVGSGVATAQAEEEALAFESPTEEHPEDHGVDIDPQEAESAVEFSGQPQAKPKIPWIRWVEIGLGFLAFGTGVTAYGLRRRE